MSTHCRICGKPTTQAGDGWDGMCPECADIEHAKSEVDPLDFGSIDMDVLEDDSDAYGLQPGTVFVGVIRLLGTFAHVSLVQCCWQLRFGRYSAMATDFKLQHLVDAALAADSDAYEKDNAEPKWVKLAAWPDRLYLLTFAPGAS